MSFSRLLDDIGRERDLRATARQAQIQMKEIRAGGRQFRRAVSGLASQLKTMAKALSVDLAASRANQRQNAIDSLANINDRATEMARTGKISGEEGAKLDLAIARAADRILGR